MQFIEHSTVEAYAKAAAEWIEEYRTIVEALQDGPNDEASAKLETHYPVADALITHIIDTGILLVRMNNQCIHSRVLLAFCGFFEILDKYNEFIAQSGGALTVEETLPLKNIYNHSLNVHVDYIIGMANEFHEYSSTRKLEDELNEM